VHPSEDKGLIINTDASGRAIGSILMQESQDGKFNIISTASRVLNHAEQGYTTCEKEFISIVYALNRFKVYVYGRKIVLNTDNKALTFLNKCVITSNRVARWMVEICQFDVEIRHIKGVQNHLADILSRNPSGLTDKETRNPTRPDQVMVHHIQLYEDKSLKQDLKTLATLQETDDRLAALKREATAHPTDGDQLLLRDDVLYCRDGKLQQRWKAMLPHCLESKVFKFTHFSLGHSGVEKGMEEIKRVFCVRNLGRKLRRFIACCEVCQRTKHLNRSHNVEEKRHLPKKPGDVRAVDVYGSLPVARGNVRYVFVCYDVFSKFVKLYALKSATTKACLNKLVNNYFGNVITPRVILSDNATQFRSPSWRKALQQHGVEVRFAPVRHPESNPSERCMRELSKFCRIYCHENHKQWGQLLQHIERWVNNTVASSTGYTPCELMYGTERPNIFSKLTPKVEGPDQETEAIEQKLENAYARMRKRALAREKRRKRGKANWEPQLQERVLVKVQPVSDAIKGITSKFMNVYEGPYFISKVLNNSAYEVQD
jgi:hypothetical protein